MAEKSLDDQLKEIQIAREQAELEKIKEETALVRKQVNAKWYSGRSLGQITAVALTVVALYSAVDQLFLKDIKRKEARLAKVEAALFQAQVDSLDNEKARITATIGSITKLDSINEALGIQTKEAAEERESIQKTVARLKNKAKLDSIAIATARAKARWDSIDAQRQMAKANKQVAVLNLQQKKIAATLDTLKAKAALEAADFAFLSTPAVFKNAMKQYRMIKKEGYYERRLNPHGKGIENKYEKKVVAGRYRHLR